MRITNKLITNSVSANIQRNLSKLARTQEELSTSKSMLRPSDKPENMSQLLSVKRSLSYLEQYQKNVDDGLGYMYLSDSSMQTIGDVLHQAGELAIQGANDTCNSEDRKAIAEQIDKMIDQVKDMANSTVGGRFIYAGTDNSKAPFERVGDKIIYKGDFEGIYREVLTGDTYRIDAPGVTRGYDVEGLVSASGLVPDVTKRPDTLSNTGMFNITYNGADFVFSNQTGLDGVTPLPLETAHTWNPATGELEITAGDLDGIIIQIDTVPPPAVNDQYKITVNSKLGVFGHADEVAGEYVVYDSAAPPPPKVQTDKGVFDMLFELRDSLIAGDSSGIETGIGNVQAKTDELLERRVGIGSRTKHFEALKDQMNDVEVKLTDTMDKLEGADMYKLSINMSQEQATYQASLASGASIMKVSLLDFLK